MDLLFEAAEIVAGKHPEFRLLIVGDGPLRHQAETYVQGREWCRYVGPKFGRQKALLLSISQLWINPGLVGLGILDAFCARLPLVTTDLPLHSPEIEYLENGRNGLIVPSSAASIADGVSCLLSDGRRLDSMRDQALKSAGRYNVETMVGNFASGIRACLSQF